MVRLSGPFVRAAYRLRSVPVETVRSVRNREGSEVVKSPIWGRVLSDPYRMGVFTPDQFDLFLTRIKVTKISFFEHSHKIDV